MIDWKFLLEKYALGRHRPQKYETKVKRYIRRVHGGTFADIGAGTGLYSKLVGDHFDRIYAFEPNPPFREKIQSLALPNCQVVPLALSNIVSPGKLWIDDLNEITGSANTIMDTFEYCPPSMTERSKIYKGKMFIQINQTTFDTFFHGQSVDLAKIDVEGAEFLVLQGMSDSLKNHRVWRLVVELHNFTRKKELESLFRGYGYRWLKWLDRDHLRAEIYEEL